MSLLKRWAVRAKKYGARDRYKTKMIAAGRCAMCGEPRGNSPFKTFCRYHGLKRRLYYQRWSGQVPKKGRGPGAPLRDIPIRDAAQLERLKEKGELNG
jgi:hypothetical protein